jgi:HEAT repeat protein
VHAGEPAVPALVEALGDPGRYRAIPVILILGAIRARDSVESLIRLMESEADLAGSAIWALGEIGDARASTPLVKRLSDSSSTIRQAAEEALGKLD